MKKCQYVFYNPETGDRFKDLWLGLKKACRKAGLEDVNWHTFAAGQKRKQSDRWRPVVTKCLTMPGSGKKW